MSIFDYTSSTRYMWIEMVSSKIMKINFMDYSDSFMLKISLEGKKLVLSTYQL